MLFHLTLCCPAAVTLLQTPTDKEWFQGTADAVRQYAWLLTDTKNRNIEDVVILSGDHL
jgi:glucose-1-phosphate adenylyltransferase